VTTLTVSDEGSTAGQGSWRGRHARAIRCAVSRQTASSENRAIASIAATRDVE